MYHDFPFKMYNFVNKVWIHYVIQKIVKSYTSLLYIVTFDSNFSKFAILNICIVAKVVESKL